MVTIARASRHLVLALVVAGLLASLGATRVDAATFSVRFEAGPQRGVTFDSTWHITSTKTITLSSPATVSGSRRVTVGSDRWLKIASGSLLGRWVKESRMAYVPALVGQTTYSPPRAGTLAPGTYELYQFGTGADMAAARPWIVTEPTTFRTTGRAFIKGRSYVRIADGAWTGWWLPGVTSAPTRIACTAGSPPADTTARRVASVAGATGEIALTFDMGGRLTDAMKIMKWLELERICATIFPTGAAAQTTIGRQVMAEIEAHPELFELGNHTVHHCNLRDGGGGAACPPAGTRPSNAFVAAELQDADAILADLGGSSSVPYWRPPYGAVDTALVNAAGAAGYPYTMMWSTDTIDWRPVADGGPTAAQISAKIVAGRTAGGIVLMHLGGYNTRNSLAATITGLYAAGYTPTSLSALYRSGH